MAIYVIAEGILKRLQDPGNGVSDSIQLRKRELKMSFLETIGGILVRKIKQPIFVKEFTTENTQLEELNELVAKLKPSPKREMVERDIAFIKQGIEGEKNVAFELKNSFLPILCLHDIRLEYEDYIAQFDFIVISNKFLCVLETKKLNGDIEITGDGDFIRTIKGYNGRFIKKEGMYSPISQNERHVNILKQILSKEKLVASLPFKSLVVMANPKTILNKTKAPKTIQNSIYKYDQVITFLKGLQDDKKNDKNMLEKYMYDISEYLLKNNKPLKMDYLAKYGLVDSDYSVGDQVNDGSIKEIAVAYNDTAEAAKVMKTTEIKRTVSTGVNKSSENLVEALKKFRMKVSKEEGLKPYHVFIDKELEDLIKVMPRNRKELQQVKGFSEKKVAKYGDAIIRILNG